MREFLDKMRDQYDMIIIDTPPVMAISDCIVLSKIVDTTLFVVRWQKTSREVVKTAMKQLRAFNVNIAGVVLTRVDMEKQSKYSYGDKGTTVQIIMSIIQANTKFIRDTRLLRVLNKE